MTSATLEKRGRIPRVFLDASARFAAAYSVMGSAHELLKLAAAERFTIYDRKHLIDQPQVAERSGLNIVTPDVVVKLIRDQDDDENSSLN